MIINRLTTMNLGACIGYTSALTNRRLAITSKSYNEKTFYDNKNYQWIIKALDDGYDIANDLLEYMQDYSDILLSIIDRHTSHSKKWKSKLKHQSSLSSYHTTKRAQSQVIRSPVKLAQLIQSRHDAIQQVIITYRQHVRRMYPSERLGTAHKHYRSHEMEKLFRNAYSHVERVANRLDKFHQQEKATQKAIDDAKQQCENLQLNETTSKSKLRRAYDHQEDKERDLMYIKQRIIHAEQELNEEKENYRQKATEIYYQCRTLEEERLNQIRETLIKFVEATHSSEYSTEQDALYEDLLSNIVSEQDTECDLDFWARTYGVNISKECASSDIEQNDDESETTAEPINASHQNETSALTTIEESTNETVTETEENPSVTSKPTGQTKAKSKKNNNGANGQTTPDIAT